MENPGWLMWGQFATWAVFAAVWLSLMPKKQKDETFVRESNYNGSLFVTIPLSLLVWLTGLSRVGPWFAWQEAAGLVLTLLGLAGAVYARFVLGHYWDIHAAGRKDGTFLEVFPYGLVRHPIYSAQLLMCLGTALSAADLGVFAILVGGSYLLLLDRARREEALLNKLTGGAYFKRFSTVGRFVPRF